MDVFAAKGPAIELHHRHLGAASVAHIYGQNLVAAESMTSALVPWGFSPRMLKPIIDLEFASRCESPGHSHLGASTVGGQEARPEPDDLRPILQSKRNLGRAGETLGDLSIRAMLTCSSKVSSSPDVAYFYGEEAPLAGLYGEGSALPKDLPIGYGFDFVNSDVILHRLSCANGGLETASGMHYRALYLGGSSHQMTLPVLRKFARLVKAVAVVVGDRPAGSPSLTDKPAEFAAIVDELWGKQQERVTSFPAKMSTRHCLAWA